MKSCNRVLGLPVLAGASLLAICVSMPAIAQSSVEELQRQIAAQQAQIAAQQEQLDKQADELEAMNRALAGLLGEDAESLADSGAAPASTSAVPAATSGGTSLARAPSTSAFPGRDSVGDLNSASVVAGDFPGSFRIAGGRDVSLAIGGFAKVVAMADSDAESAGSNFLPAFLGTKTADRDGRFGVDATLSRLFVDGRAPVGEGSARAYVEWDFNQPNNGTLEPRLRHAYGQWTNGSGTSIVGGHTWTTFMNTNILPEGLTEPTVSGPIFTRQALIRLAQSIASGVTLNVALENPNSTDVFDPGMNTGIARTRFPDGIVRFDFDGSPTKQLSIAGIVRDLRVRLPASETASEVAWGLTANGYIVPFDGDKFIFSGAYGKGVGRYLLGIQPNAGSVIDPTTGEILLRKNWGLVASYRHAWSDSLRSTLTTGYAKSVPFDWQPDSTFKDSTYASLNLMWRVSPVMTAGVEYNYGMNENKVGDQLDNHRVVFGIQFF